MTIVQERPNGVWSGAFSGTYTDAAGVKGSVTGDAGYGNISISSPNRFMNVGGKFDINNNGTYTGVYSIPSNTGLGSTGGKFKMIKTSP